MTYTELVESGIKRAQMLRKSITPSGEQTELSLATEKYIEAHDKMSLEWARQRDDEEEDKPL